MNIEKSLKLPYTKFVKLLKDEAAKEKVRALIKSGRDDGFPNDEEISFSKGTVIARDLTPTQQQLLIESSIKWAIIGKDSVGLQEILTGRPVEINGKAIVTLNGKYVIDGHHRWAEAFIMNPNSKIVNLDMQINIEPLEALKIIQMSIAANAGDIPFSRTKGVNLYKISKDAFVTYVLKNVTKTVLEMFVKTDVELAEYLWEHVEILRSSHQPIKGAPDRVYMPQPDKATGAIKDLEDGKIDFKKPFAKKENRIPSWDNFILEYEHINEGSKQYRPGDLFKVIGSYSQYNPFGLIVGTHSRSNNGTKIKLTMGTEIKFDTVAPNGYVWFYFTNPETKKEERGFTESGSLQNMLNANIIKAINKKKNKT